MVGHEAERVRDNVAGWAVTVVVNPEYAAVVSTSVQDDVRPFATSALIDRLIDLFAETRKTVVRPLLGDRSTNPVLMSAVLFPELLAQRGDVGGREIVDRQPDEVCLLAVNDSRLIADIDSAADYEAARRCS